MRTLVAVGGAAAGHLSFDGGGHTLPSGRCPRLFIVAVGSCRCCGFGVVGASSSLWVFAFVGGCYLLWACTFMGDWWLLGACTFVSGWW